MTDVIERLRGAEDHTAASPAVLVSEVVRAGERRLRRRRALGAGACAVVLAGAVSLAAVLDPAGDAAPTAGEGRLELLDRPQTALDRLPSWVDLEVVPSSSRRVWTFEDVSVYAAEDPAGRVCVVLLPGPPELAGASCAAPADFARQGVWVAVGPPGTEAHLVPDGDEWRAPGVMQGKLVQGATENLYVVLPPG